MKAVPRTLAMIDDSFAEMEGLHQTCIFSFPTKHTCGGGYYAIEIDDSEYLMGVVRNIYFMTDIKLASPCSITHPGMQRRHSLQAHDHTLD